MKNFFKHPKNIYFLVICVLFFIIGINPYATAKYFFLLLFFVVAIKSIFCRELRFTPLSILFGLLGLSFFLFRIPYYGFSFSDFFRYGLGFWAACFIGHSLFFSSKEKKLFIYSILFFAIGSFIGATLSFVRTTIDFGLFPNTRVFEDFFTGEIGASTIFTITMTPLYAVAFFVLLYPFVGRKWWHIVLSFVVIGLNIYINIAVGNRAFIIISVALLVFVSLFSLLHNKTGRKQTMWIDISIVSICVLGLLAFYTIPAFQNKLLNISIIGRLFKVGFGGTRGALYVQFFQEFWHYVWGGMSVALSVSGGTYYVHNVWFDFYAIAGIVPFVLFILITIWVLYLLLRVVFLHKSSDVLRFSYTLFLAIVCTMLVEPVIQNNIYTLFVFCSLCGFYELSGLEAVESYVPQKMFNNLDFSKLKIVQINNYLSVHQGPFYDEMVKQFGDRYHFVAMLDGTKKSQRCYQEQKPNEIRFYLSDEEKQKANDVLTNADIILCGSVTESFLKKYRKKGKIIIKTSERLYKDSLYGIWYPKALLSQMLHFWPLILKQKDYIFCDSCYSAYTYSSINYSLDRYYKWAYTTKPASQNIDQLLQEKAKHGNTVVFSFVSRLIKLKHPETVVHLATALKDKGMDFHLNIIGDGDQRPLLEKMVADHQLEKYVTFTGSINNDKVLSILAASDAVLSSSDTREGWGATINEGMNNACVPLVSHYVGCSAYLVDTGIDGYIYDFNNEEELFDDASRLCSNHELLISMQRKSYEKMTTTYSAENMVSRFKVFIQDIIAKGYSDSFTEGPCSKDTPKDEDERLKEESKQLIVATSATDKATPDASKKTLTGSKFIKNALVSYSIVILNVVAGLLYTPWLIKSLGTSDYGVYSICISLINLVIFDFGLGLVVSKFISSYIAKKDYDGANHFMGVVYKVYAIIGLAAVAILAVLFFFLQNIYYKLTADELSKLRISYIILGVFMSANFIFMPLDSILIGNDDFFHLKTISLLSKAINIAAVVIGLLINANLYVYLLAICLSNILSAVIKIIYINAKHLAGSKPVIFHKSHFDWRLLVTMSVWAFIASIASRLMNNIGPNLLGIISGTLAVTIFSVAVLIEDYIWEFASAIKGMFIPKLSFMNEAGATPKEYDTFLTSYGRVQFAVSAWIITGFFIFGRAFINNVWKAGNTVSFDEAYWGACLLLIPDLITTVQGPFESLAIVKDKIKYIAYVYLASFVLSLGLSVGLCFALPGYQVLMVCLGTCIGKLLCQGVFENWVFHKKLGLNVGSFFFNVYLKNLWPFLIVVGLGVGIEFVYPTVGWISLFAKAVIYSVIYWSLLMLFASNDWEKNLAASYLRKIRFKVIKLREPDDPEISLVDVKEANTNGTTL